MSGTNFVFFTKSDLILHAALPKSSMVDSDDDTMHVPKRKRLRILEDDLVCSEYVHSKISISMTTPACKTAQCVKLRHHHVQLHIRQTMNLRIRKILF